MIPCTGRIFWWDIFATAHCLRPAGHMGAHADGVRWFNDDGFMVDGTNHAEVRPLAMSTGRRSLTARQVTDIRARFDAGESVSLIAAAVHVDRSIVYLVAHRRTYKDVA